MKKNNIICLLFTLLWMPAFAQNAAEVLDDARLANAYFMKKHADPTVPTFVKKERPSSLWTRGVYYEGLMALQEIDPNHAYINYALRWADFHKWTPRNGIKTTDADDQCCAQTYVQLLPYAGRDEKKLLQNVINNLNHQMESGRSDYWTWIDAIQMAMPLYFQIAHLTGERRYADYAMQCYRWTRNECGGGLYNQKNGFWWRDKDFVPPYKESDGNDCYWSRGDGWVYAALVRVMETLSPKDKYYKELKKDFLQMSHAFASCQREDGFWNVSLVSPATYGGPEATGTSLFLYGMSWGISQKILPVDIYKPICDRAWQALHEKSIHPNGFLGYVQGTGKQPSDSQPVTYTSVPDFEDFGLGCYLLGATAYYRLLVTQ